MSPEPWRDPDAPDPEDERTFVQPPPSLWPARGEPGAERRPSGETLSDHSDEAKAFWDGDERTADLTGPGEAPTAVTGDDAEAASEGPGAAPATGGPEGRRPYRMYVVEEAAYPREARESPEPLEAEETPEPRDSEPVPGGALSATGSADVPPVEEAETGVYVVPDGDDVAREEQSPAGEGDARDDAAATEAPPRLKLLQGGASEPAAAAGAPAAVDVPVPRRTYQPGEDTSPSLGVGLPRRLAAWLTAHLVDVLTLSGLLTVVGIVHAWGMSRYPAFLDDEGTYVSQAWAVIKLHALAPYTYWYDHPPFGWLQLAAWSSVVPSFGPHHYAIATARVFILVMVLASAACVYLIARRMQLARPFAALAVLLFTLSPLALWYQRMVLLDNIGLMWLLLALVLALTPQGRLFAYGAAGVALAGAVLSKETFLLFAPAVALAVWQTSRTSSRRFAVAVFVTLFVLVGSFYPLFALLRGEVLPGPGHTSLIHGIVYQLTRPGSGSITDTGSQTFAVVRGWLQTDPWVLVLGLLALPLALALRRSRPVGVALLIPALMLLRPNGYLPAMYVIGLLPFAALVIALAADWGWTSARSFDWSRGRRRGDQASPSLAKARVYRASATRWTRAGRVLGVAVGAVVIGMLLWGPVRAWPAPDRTATTVDAAAPARAAVDWLDAHASKKAYLLVDDSVWTDLVDRGFKPSHTIWYSKLDLDPSLGGTRWNKFTYVVRSSLVRLRDWGPNARAVWEHGRTVATFRQGRDSVEIRRVGKVTQLPSQPGTGP